MPDHVVAGVGRTGRALARSLVDRRTSDAQLVQVDLDAPDAPTDASSVRLAAPSGRGTGRSWYLGRLAAEGVPERLAAAPRATVLLSAGGGTGSGSAARVLDAVVADDAYRVAAVVLPPLRGQATPEDVNAVYALGSLAARGAAILVADPDHVGDLLVHDRDPFLLGEADAEKALHMALTEALTGLDDLARSGWGPRDFTQALGGPALVVPSALRVEEPDLSRVNLTGWILSALEGSSLARCRVADAEAVLVSVRIPSAWSKHPGFRSREEIQSILKAAAPHARIDVEIAYTVGGPDAARIHAFVVARSVPRVLSLARAGAQQALDPGFGTSVTKALEIVAGAEGSRGAGFVEEYREAAEALTGLVRAG